MDKQHEARIQALKSRYPYQFNKPTLGFDFEPGWVSIIEEVCGQIDALLGQPDHEWFGWSQIKEKFGGLKMYFNGTPHRVPLVGPDHSSLREQSDEVLIERIREITREAETRSVQTCMVCGTVGTLRTQRKWWMTLCDEHRTFSYSGTSIGTEDESL